MFSLGLLFTSPMEILQLPQEEASGLNRWTHFVLNFNVKQQELRLYQNGLHVQTDSTKSNNTYLDNGLGMIAIGKTFTRS